MRPRHAVLLTPSKSSHPTQFPSRQHFVHVSPLDATLMVSPANVANKRLTVALNPLDATLTKIRGRDGSPTFQRGCLSKLALTLSPTPYPLFFHTLVHSPTQRHWHNSFPVNQLRTLFIATEGVPLSPHLGSRHSTPIVTLYVQRSFLPYLVTSLLRSISPRFARLLLHCSPHGSPTPRPTLPRRSPLARRDRTRHSRFTAFHGAAATGRSALLDRNWFRTR